MLTWHRFLRDLQLMAIKVQHASIGDQILCGGLLIFSLAILSVGISRIVEFHGLGLSPLRIRILSVMHVFGCIALALGMALVGIDTDKLHLVGLSFLMGFALIILFPIHIYIGLLRRIKLKDRAKG